MNKENSVLWLDFENENSSGTFYSYGIGARTYGSIWPDRKPQPEMWQMRKSAQPVDFKWIDNNDNFIVEIWNKHSFIEVDKYLVEWFLTEDCKIVQRGIIDENIAPLHKKNVAIPISIPEINILRYEPKINPTHFTLLFNLYDCISATNCRLCTPNAYFVVSKCATSTASGTFDRSSVTKLYRYPYASGILLPVCGGMLWFSPGLPMRMLCRTKGSDQQRKGTPLCRCF